jgi:hypothetical protein
MKRLFILAAMAILLSGCVSYRGGSIGPDSPANPYVGRGTSGVSSGADPSPEVTGSEFAPR